MFLIAYTFKGQVHKFAGRVKIVSHSSCRTSAIFKYFCPVRLVVSSIQRINCVYLISARGCPHVSKSINFSAMKKGLGKQAFGECAVSIIAQVKLKYLIIT